MLAACVNDEDLLRVQVPALVLALALTLTLTLTLTRCYPAARQLRAHLNWLIDATARAEA